MGEACHDPLDGLCDHVALSEDHGLDFASDQSQVVPEVGAHGRQVVIAGMAVDVMIAAIGEQACEGDQYECGVEFLAYAALGLCVEVLDHGLFVAADTCAGSGILWLETASLSHVPCQHFFSAIWGRSRTRFLPQATATTPAQRRPRRENKGPVPVRAVRRCEPDGPEACPARQSDWLPNDQDSRNRGLAKRCEINDVVSLSQAGFFR